MSSPRGLDVGGMAGMCILRAELGCCVMACLTSPMLGFSGGCDGDTAERGTVFGDEERKGVM
jgi:hypothetical protein